MQRRPWGTIAVVVFALLLGSYIFFFEKELPSTDEQKAGENKLVPLRELDEVIGLSGTSGEAPWAIMRTAGTEEWQIIAPLLDRADAEQVNQLLGLIIGANSLRRLELNPEEPLATYGLEPPIATIVIAFADGTTGRLLIGEVDPFGNGDYMMLDGSKNVHIASGIKEVFAELDIRNLRDRSLIGYQAFRATSLTIQAGEKEIIFDQSSGSWQMAAPATVMLDQGKISALVSTLAGLQVTEWAAENLDTLEQYGLDQPVITMTLAESDTQLVTLNFGTIVDDQIYLTASGRNAVFTVDAGIISKLPQDAYDFGAKQLTPYNMYSIDGLTIAGEEINIELHREGMQWQGIDQGTATASIGALAALPFTTYQPLPEVIAPRPLDDATYRMTFKTYDNNQITIYAWRDDDSFIIWRDGDQASGTISPATALTQIFDTLR